MCNKDKCNIEIASKLSGIRKCSIKKRFIVGLSTLKPPQSQLTIYLPKIGKAPKIFVITVAPHKLI
jgi:hypothetical protein